MNVRLDSQMKLSHRKWGEKFDDSDIMKVSLHIRNHFQGTRVLIENKHGYRRAGVVSMTTGWKPALLLMHRSSDIGSGDVIGPDDVLIAVNRGNRYINPRTGKQEKVKP